MPDGLRCGCTIETVGKELHLYACCDEHGRYWEEHLPDMLAEMGLDIPVETEEP